MDIRDLHSRHSGMSVLEIFKVQEKVDYPKGGPIEHLF
jgi:hypothetical protein